MPGEATQNLKVEEDCKESAKLRTTHAVVPYLLSCLTYFVPYVFSPFMCLVYYVFSCFTGLAYYEF